MLRDFEGHQPQLAEGVWLAPSSVVLGQVQLGPNSSVWYQSVLRGDDEPIEIGESSNIQDLCVLHITAGMSQCRVGKRVTVGHRAILHGCTVQDDVLVGMGSTILDGAIIEPWCLIGAGTLISPGKVIPSGSVVMGSPGRVIRSISDTERALIEASALHYVELAARHCAAATTVSDN